MASTYSDLKIQLMATGENSGTWGTVTNINLGTAIEEAIVGSVDVPFSSADVTLTLTDTNASQSARNLRLNLTGTVSTGQNLIVPAIEKVYIINNGLGQTITVKNTTGTGIAVPAGKTLYVYNNGTNVLDAITHLTSLTLASALPVDSGGTGSNTATFSGANITSLNASSISSGSLDNARTTAASANGASTIVARDASGNFTGATITATTFSGAFSGSGASVTSINATNISSGTLAVARGGTGTGTTPTNGQLLIGNGSGFTLATITAGTGISVSTGAGSTTVTNSGVTSATGTSNQVTVSASTGSVTFSLPQSISTGSSVQFGSFGVGTGASGTTGEIRATNNITAFFSDARLKDVVGPIDNALEKVSKIRGVYYTQNKLAESFGYNNYEQQVGVIAQEIKEVLPEAVKFAPFDREMKDGNEVSKSGEEYLTVQYEKLVPLLLQAIKELKGEVDLLKAKQC